MEAILERDLARLEAAARDKDKLQGTWNFVSGRREAELTVLGERFTIRFTNGETYSGTFSLDPTSRPKAMDLNIDTGPEPHRGKTALAIYQLDGQHLIWCPNQPGVAERAWAFPPEEDTNYLCLIFRRAKQ